MNEQVSGGAADDSYWAEAHALARRRRYAEAMERLTEAHARGECADAEALDLKARICAQQGLLLQAEACWRQAQLSDPSNPTYEMAMTALRRRHRPFAAWWRAAGWVAVATLLVVVGVLVGQGRATDGDRVALEHRVTVAIADSLARTQAEAARRQEAADRNLRESERRLGDRIVQDNAGLARGLARTDLRLQAEMRRQQQTVVAKVVEAEARQRARADALEVTLRKMQEALAALQANAAQK
jgi:hypothetical protein